MEFKLTITLGNAAMQSGDDVAEALDGVARKLANKFDSLTLPETQGTIQDLNGNNVGTWSVTL